MVRQWTRLKNQVHAVLHQQGLRSPATDLFGRRGRLWLGAVKLPVQARESVDTCQRILDRYTDEIEKQSLHLSEKAKQDERVRWLMTIPGIGEVSAMMVLAEIGAWGGWRTKRRSAVTPGWCRGCGSRRARRQGAGSRGRARVICAG
jgi:transposase